ncbi:hypothetical protein SUGI_0481490 [Cryptomeria japonica]|nr:hypothetical protein SUGI_0481490 [Cryptomeria japonica]
MVVSAGGDLPPPPTDPILDPAMLTLFVTSSLGSTVVPPSDLMVPQINGSSSESSQATPVVSDSNPIPEVSVILTMQPLTVNANLKGWKNMLVGNTETVDPNFVPIYLQTKEGTSFEIPDVVLDHILQNMANTLVGKFFSLHPMVEMVKKWVKDKWKLKGTVFFSAMLGSLFLFKFTIEEDVALVLSGCWSYGQNNLSLYL